MTKKLLQINIEVNRGSTGRIAEQIGEIAIESGFESYICYARGYNPSRSNVIRIGSKLSFLSHVLKTRLFGDQLRASTFATKKLISKIKEINPDIIHLHQLHGYYLDINIFFDFLVIFNKPVIWTLHDCWAYTGHCCYYERVSCKKWLTECSACPLKHYYPQSWFFDNSNKNYRVKKYLFNNVKDLTLVPVSNWLGSEVSLSFLKDKNILPIENGIDLRKFIYSDPSSIRIKHNLGNKKIILGVASPWSDLKGLKDFVKLSEMVESDTQIILIGLTESQKKGLPENIIGISRLADPHDLARYYSLADVFVNPSIAESFGLVTVEAMSCGTPVVGYNVTATPELIAPGAGFVVEKGDIKGLMDKIKTVLDLGRSHFSEATRKRVMDNYNHEKQYRKYIELYESKLNQQSLKFI